MDNSKNSSSVCVAIFSARETPEILERTVAAALRASTPVTPIDVMVNGNRALGEHLAASFRTGASADAARVRIWYLAPGDKANAWNQHIHHIWDGASLAFYVDGYVELDANAISQLTHTMHAQPEALAGSGVPSVGRSSKRLRQDMLTLGGMHGNFCCIRDSALRALRQRKMLLPCISQNPGGNDRFEVIKCLVGCSLSFRIAGSPDIFMNRIAHVAVRV